MFRTSFIICFLLFGFTSFSNKINYSLYINRGIYTAVDNTQFPMVCFNNSGIFDSYNPVIKITANDTLVLKVFNNDTVYHGFDIKYIAGAASGISPGDSVSVSFHSANKGCFIYYDDSFGYDYAYSGASGMIVVEDVNENAFYWTIKDVQDTYNTAIMAGNAVNWADYYPDYFTINGKSNPDINNDSLARVQGNVGDTIYIYIANTGKAKHSLHFHGYHSEIVYSSRFPSHSGRNKDTFPIYEMETIILMMIPDKPGEFPVHDHNLVAVTGGMIYPSGMFLTMLISP